MNIESSNRLHATRRACLAVAIAAPLFLSSPKLADAQEVVVVQAGPTRSEGGAYRGPNWALLSTGLAVFGGTYVASAIVAGTSSHAGDKSLYAPIVGPWIDLGTRCPSGCADDMGRKVLLGFDGVFQAVGAIAIVSSFLWPDHRAPSRRAHATTFHIAPTSYGPGAPGLTMVGKF